MVANYSSYLEFIGAVYFSMSLSEFLTTRIWSPENAKMIERSLDGLGMKDDNDFKKAVTDANIKKGEQLQAELSKKSLIGLFVVAFLLIFSGVEPCYEKEELALLQLELVYTCGYFLLSMFVLQWVLFDKWKYVVLYILSVFVCFIVVRWNTWVFNSYQIESWLTNKVGFVVVFTVSIPILWQICITWVHKNVFYGYVKSKIIEAQSEYEKVMDYIKQKSFESLPKRYHEIYMRISQASDYANSKQILDDSLTEYQGVLYNDIRIIGLNVRITWLLLSWFWFQLKALWNWFKKLFKTRGKSVTGAKKLLVPNYAEYAKIFDNQKRDNRTLKMKSFCEKEKISFEEFKLYYCKYCQKKT